MTYLNTLMGPCRLVVKPLQPLNPKVFNILKQCFSQEIHMHASVYLGDAFNLDSPSPHILFNTIPPCPSQTGEGTAVKEEEWRESTFHEG